MKLSRIDLIAQNGGDGAHYKYEEVAEKITENIPNPGWSFEEFQEAEQIITKILVEAFPNDN